MSDQKRAHADSQGRFVLTHDGSLITHERAHCYTPAAAAVRGGAEQLPFAAQRFDAVVCFEMIERVTQPQRVLAEIARVLQPDGVALVSTPDTLIASCCPSAT